MTENPTRAASSDGATPPDTADAAARRIDERAARHERFLAKLAKQGTPWVNSGLNLDGTPIGRAV